MNYHGHNNHPAIQAPLGLGPPTGDPDGFRRYSYVELLRRSDEHRQLLRTLQLTSLSPETPNGLEEAQGRQQEEEGLLMASADYQADKEIEEILFAPDVDFDLYSAAQVTDIVSAFFIDDVDADVTSYLG